MHQRKVHTLSMNLNINSFNFSTDNQKMYDIVKKNIFHMKEFSFIRVNIQLPHSLILYTLIKISTNYSQLNTYIDSSSTVLYKY